ncbi:MAG: hypoxanthine phosphoribosyltransferase [Magnetococcales bacterium]|uniref:Hypoxanthine phosphoribosyltransferase n=1 Tax=Candidatus Magnetobacterium casense TaxID=1455061 RepID=A0ABS6RY60_9BACT|nr:hypoxanthine phosphoribosyltransferase [Candidatus Magnetobacterium casensis]MBF0608887.1 hypoxanthine phosphoribosyltransferase [Nitrospirota bacterium]MBV6341168.1 hypoxanthine phosphoribosyltransferase [Candidatus Magnetobacterium casensis]
MVVGKPLFTEEQIRVRVHELGKAINADYKGKSFLAVGILKGACVFFADLIRQLNGPLAMDFIIASSYVDTQTTGNVFVHYDIRQPIEGKDILLVEDIIDTGITLHYLRDMLLQRGPASLKICAFLDKKSRRTVDVAVDYVGFEIPDEFVIGYGVDYNDQFRNLPYISTLKKAT